MSDDTTKLMPVYVSDDDKTRVMPETPAPASVDETRVMPVDSGAAHDADATTVMPAADATSHESDETTVLPAAPDHAEDGTVTLPTVTPTVPADTEVMAPAIEVRSQEAEDAQATQALEQIPSDLDDFAEPAADADGRSDAEPSAANPLLDQPIMNAAYGAVPPASVPGPSAADAPDPSGMPDSASGPAVPPAPDVHAAPATPVAKPEPPKGPSVPTIVFGVLGVLLGVVGLFVGLDMDLIGDWLVTLTPQTVIAVLCAATGALLLVVALIWGIVKAVAKPKSGSAAGVE
ncbi:hypothetical protein JS528_10920 [Bifidobacterium sp. MA2]|uniref:Uncharacterized protein n=1 Tax=Bifidobacterium santillanense TaxID=2809028 RepID=A0ABS5USC6_9BIFI|nr:hypothetical protein [Bifidobacterium santillanense]MBT1173834.1 hypothetical protein [Bifidobacterium santillanense]